MSILNYIIPFILPPGMMLSLFLFCILIWWSKPFLSRSLALLTILCLYLFSTPFFAVYFASHFEKYPALKMNMLPTDIERIVVIGPWHNIKTDSLMPMNGKALSRIHYAIWLNEKAKIPISIAIQKPHNDLESRHSLLINKLLAMEAKKIPVEYLEKTDSMPWSDTTEIAKMMKKKDIKSIFLVTESWHMPMAVLAFEKEGIRVVPAPTAFSSNRFKHEGVEAYLPHAEALASVSLLIHESIRFYTYRLKQQFFGS